MYAVAGSHHRSEEFSLRAGHGDGPLRLGKPMNGAAHKGEDGARNGEFHSPVRVNVYAQRDGNVGAKSECGRLQGDGGVTRWHLQNHVPSCRA